jgi:CBS domain-containing protein
MLSDYAPLQLQPLGQTTNLAQRNPLLGSQHKINEPALQVMTDLRHTRPVTIDAEASIATAEERMRHRGVRLLFVVDDEEMLRGLITATDLFGEKPMQHIQRHGGHHHEILVADLMTPRERLDALPLNTVLNARIGHVISTLKACRRQHALVTDLVEGVETVCGLFSASRIARQLGLEISITPLATTFVEIEYELTH